MHVLNRAQSGAENSRVLLLYDMGNGRIFTRTGPPFKKNTKQIFMPYVENYNLPGYMGPTTNAKNKTNTFYLL